MHWNAEVYRINVLLQCSRFTRKEIIHHNQVISALSAYLLLIAAEPEVMVTFVTLLSGKTAPRKENPLSSFLVDAANFPRLLSPSKNSKVVELALSTSDKTTPNPFTKAAVAVPGTLNVTSILLLPVAAKVRAGLNALNWSL